MYIIDFSRLIPVSIPFKRESTFKPYAIVSNNRKFQFPSNGKAHLNRNTQATCVLLTILVTLSIPFKRESTFKQKAYQGLCDSLQTKL